MKYLPIFLFLVGCIDPNPGDVRQKEVYKICLKSKLASGVGPAMTGSGGVAVTVSKVCIKEQVVFVTEKYEFNEWRIIKVDLVED